jgi:hypothetical protein
MRMDVWWPRCSAASQSLRWCWPRSGFSALSPTALRKRKEQLGRNLVIERAMADISHYSDHRRV